MPFSCSSELNTGARTSRARSALLANHLLEGREIALQRRDGVLLLRQFKNRRGIPPGKARILGFFCSHRRPVWFGLPPDRATHGLTH